MVGRDVSQQAGRTKAELSNQFHLFSTSDPGPPKQDDLALIMEILWEEILPMFHEPYHGGIPLIRDAFLPLEAQETTPPKNMLHRGIQVGLIKNSKHIHIWR